jgi:hypothetical protein
VPDSHDLVAQSTVVTRTRSTWQLVVEGCAVVLSPVIAFFVLKIRPMAQNVLPDPSMHTIYIIDPRDVFTRYAAVYQATHRLRESTQVGFLVPARLAYLAFGALPGFFVTRYFFALVAIVPAYLLLRRLYGIPSGAVAVILLLSSPVIITAWGTDYPDSAVVSYVAGAVACFAMPCRERWRPAWLALGVALLTAAIWSHGVAIFLAGTTVGVYLAVRLVRDRRHLLQDIALLAGVAASLTFILMVASKLLIGQFDFIRPALSAAGYLNEPAQVRITHSTNRDWVLYVAYLLVPPSVIAAFAVTFIRKLRAIPTPQLVVGLACAAQCALFGYLQFLNHVQTLEQHYFSSTIWGVISLALAVTLAQLCRPLCARPMVRWLPPALLVAVPLAYKADRHVPAFGWWPTGAAVAAIPVVLAGIMRLAGRGRGARSAQRVGLVLAAAATVVGVTGSLLILTVAPSPSHAPLHGIAPAGDPAPTYATALGGSGTIFVDWYQIGTELLSFVGNATYQSEQLMMWYPAHQTGALVPVIGMYHAPFNSLVSSLPVFTPTDAMQLEQRRPAELLFLSVTGAQFSTALTAVARYRPVVVRTTVMRYQQAVLHVWLVVLGSFAHAGVA